MVDLLLEQRAEKSNQRVNEAFRRAQQSVSQFPLIQEVLLHFLPSVLLKFVTLLLYIQMLFGDALRMNEDK